LYYLKSHLCSVETQQKQLNDFDFIFKYLKTMKTIKITATLLAAMMFANATSVLAESHHLLKDTKVVKRSAKSVELRVNQPKTDELTVEIIDLQGVIMYSGSVSNPASAIKVFDLQKLPNGLYFVVCSNSTFWSSQQLLVNGEQVEVVDNSYQELQTPTLRALEGNRFEVLSHNPNIFVTITDRHGEVVYNDFLAKGRVFNLGNLLSGDCRFDFSINNRSFTQFVSIK
jgi:hypothetical protein